MSIFSGIMAGSCMVIVPGTETIDEFGQPITGTEIETGPYRCYFFQPNGTVIDLQSGEHRKKNLRVMLPSNVAVEVNDTIRGRSDGYRADYRVLSVDPAYTFDVVDHWECDLQVIL